MIPFLPFPFIKMAMQGTK